MKKRALILLLILFVIYVAHAFINPFPQKNVPEGFRPKYGITFSFEQAGWYGLNPRESYVRLITQNNFDWVRLPFFWDHPSMSSGQDYLNGLGNIEDLEFAILEAGKRNIKIVVALGAKTPYYPEYHLPSKIKEKIKFGDKIGSGHPIAQDLLAIDKKVVERLSQFDNIAYWQVENEPYLANVNNWKLEDSLLAAELEVVRIADPKKRPVILSHVGPATFDCKWKKLAGYLRPGDVLGVNAYFKTQGTNLFAFSIFGNQVYVPWPKFFVWPVQSWTFLSPDYAYLKKELSKSGIDLWILEMQAEPYVRTIEDAKRSDSFYKPSDIVKADKYLRSFQIKSVGLWGAGYWQFREKLGDSSWQKSVGELVNR